jgi:hypothetical protein
MERLSLKNPDSHQYVLGKKGTGYIIFTEHQKLKIDLSNDANSYTLQWVNPVTGELLKTKKKVPGRIVSIVESPLNGPVAAWLIKGR